MKKIIIILLLLSTGQYSQNLDSLYKNLLALKGIQEGLSIENAGYGKCGFGLVAAIKENFDKFDYDRQQTIEQILARPNLQTSIVSPSGYFRIHYDNTGNNKPEYDIYELAVAFDSSYNYEVNILGYLPPPADENMGGDSKYDVYVLNLGSGLYGSTTPEVYTNDEKHISYIEMDNSFNKNEGYNTFGLDAAKVTAAHEFHHAIQIGSYIYTGDDLFYHELTSTAMEEFVYDDVNDYYAYMNSYFKNPNQVFSSNQGYDLAVWNIFLREKMNGSIPNEGDKIIKRSWELMRDKDNRAIIAIANAMSEYGYSFSKEFNIFGDWLFFTGNRSKENMFFEEASEYPLIKPTMVSELTGSELTVMFESKPTSINYLVFADYSQGLPDTIVAVLSNSDVYGSISSNNAININFTIAKTFLKDSNPINNFYYSLIEGTSTEFIYESYVINNELSTNADNRKGIDFAYPQPFNYSEDNIILIPTPTDLSGKAVLNVYSADMNLVYTSEESILLNNIVVRWNGLDNYGNKLPSGVYIYVTKANNKIKKGKIVIFNN